ncbi:mediator of RNA polymerase II transcription subunit 28-like [Watersipora subatra]|uniref:mediator of RNA polymerase II transcription subunit 28-like n=1 Tax=Watersipora subatra TaxID=2589382 RepID=UPI00355C44C3
MALSTVEFTGNCVEEFEEAFHSVCKCLEQIDEKKPLPESLKNNADVLVRKFVDAGRACEQFFLQKHIQIADSKPEQVLRDECNELKQEINKKDAAIMRYHENLRNWQQTLRIGAGRGAAIKSQQSKGGLGAPPTYTPSQHPS